MKKKNSDFKSLTVGLTVEEVDQTQSVIFISFLFNQHKKNLLDSVYVY